MIINTGMRTDIPAFFSKWLLNRIKAGLVMVRNPYNPNQVTEYLLDPKLVDCLVFCTKNPRPLLDHLEDLAHFNQIWHITLNNYGRETEPFVPNTEKVIDCIKILSNNFGPDCVIWRYDPIFIAGAYTEEFHIHAFESLASKLEGYTNKAVISFIDLYRNTLLNHYSWNEVPPNIAIHLVKQFKTICNKHGLDLVICAEDNKLKELASTRNCIDLEDLERATKHKLKIPTSYKGARKECKCILGHDIGAYNTCMHGCTYCYANSDHALAKRIFQMHDPNSPLLIGNIRTNDTVTIADQKSWKEFQLSLFD